MRVFFSSCDEQKLERLEDTKRSIERHKYHIESLEKILRAIDNDVVDLKPIQNLHLDVEYYIQSNQESDFKENELMYEEIDLDNLSSLMTPVITPPVAQSHSSLLSNGTSSSLTSNISTLMDISSTTLNLHSHLLTNHL